MYTNISTYRFASLADLPSLRERLLGYCREAGLKGTILLSTEGVNLFVAGTRDAVDILVAILQEIPGLEELSPKYSESEAQPFTRMIVRIKREIIAFGVEGIDPVRRTSPKLPARTLKQWLDEGRPVTLLDTRNDYEVKLGTFQGAKTLSIDHFRQFPAAVRSLPEPMKDEAVVMFCTGGIRCEKAGPFMEREGFRNVFQLDGGILKYFEECGGAHYEGECFVFDQRVGVDPALRETGTTQCYVCQAPLSEEEQADPRYVPNVSCPHCQESQSQRMAALLERRNLAFREVTDPLPGAEPYENRRPLLVPAAYDGRTLFEALCGIFPHVDSDHWRVACAEGQFHDANGTPLTAESPLRAGERCFHFQPGKVEPPVDPSVAVLHEDEAILVLNKPAPLPMHSCGRFHRNTLQYFLNAVYAPTKPRPAHRLDANTSGLVVCSRTRHFARSLQPQFENGTVRKTYLVEVAGVPEDEHFVCDAPIGAGPGPMGSREPDRENGLPSRTAFRVLARLPGGTTRLEAVPLTGRTNQIRVHLWQRGLPVCGDPAYLADHQLGQTMTLLPADPPMRLHAVRLEFLHPLTGAPVAFEAPPPTWIS